jgi:Methylamine utilisation protein MauE
VSTPAITAPYLAAVALLGVAGAVKAVRPSDTANALRAAGLPSHRLAVRLGALSEAAVAVAALAAPGRFTASLVAACYLGFAGFIALALRRGWVLASCGCFGRPDTPPTHAHLVLDVAGAGCSLWWAAVAPGSLAGVFDHQPWGGFPLALASAVVGYLAYLVFTNPLSAARRRSGALR